MAQVNRAALEALKDTYITDGNRSITGADLRLVLEAIIESCVVAADDREANGGYMGINQDGRIQDVSRIAVASPSGQFLKDDGTFDSVPVNPNVALFDHVDSSGNVVLSGESALYLDVVPTDTLTLDGDKLLVEYGIKLKGGTATKTVRLYFESDLIYDTGAMTVAGDADVVLRGILIRADADKLRYAFCIAGQAVSVGELTSINFSQNNDLLLTGESSTGTDEADNDVLAILGTIRFVKAAV